MDYNSNKEKILNMNDPRSTEAIPALDNISVASSRPATGGQGGALRDNRLGKVRKV